MAYYSGTTPMLVDASIIRRVSEIKYIEPIKGPTTWDHIKGWLGNIYRDYIAENKIVVLFVICLILFLYYRYKIKQAGETENFALMNVAPKKTVNINYMNSGHLDYYDHDNYNSYKPDTPYNQQVYYPPNPDIAVYPDDRFSNNYFLPYTDDIHPEHEKETIEYDPRIKP
jgi:hypothetical protein